MKNMEQPHTQHALSSTFCVLSVSGHHRKQKYMVALKMYRNKHSEVLAYIPVIVGDNAPAKYVPGCQAKITSAARMLVFFFLL